jgi:hypothetical protein
MRRAHLARLQDPIGGSVLMHETHDFGVDHRDALITTREADGYRFATPAPEFQASLR